MSSPRRKPPTTISAMPLSISRRTVVRVLHGVRDVTALLREPG
ncbi:MAG: hypothetical protein WDN08_19335 [Rhizomicrobium sp.]